MTKRNIFENPFFEIIQKAKAQGTNIVSPTLPVDTTNLVPNEAITPTPVPSDTVSASLLNANTTNDLRVNERLRVNLAITSGDTPVQSFNITFRYDDAMLRYAAQDFLDNNYEITENILVEEEESTIVIKGIAQGEPQTLNKNIAFIEFLTIDQGSTTLTISNTNLDSEILNEDGINILEETSNLTVNIGELREPTPRPSGSISITPTTTTSSLPESDIDLTVITQHTPVIAGMIILIIGLWLKKLVSSKDEEY